MKAPLLTILTAAPPGGVDGWMTEAEIQHLSEHCRLRLVLIYLTIINSRFWFRIRGTICLHCVIHNSWNRMENEFVEIHKQEGFGCMHGGDNVLCCIFHVDISKKYGKYRVKQILRFVSKHITHVRKSLLKTWKDCIVSVYLYQCWIVE